VAAAHKLARIVYHMLKEKTPFVTVSPHQEDAQYRERALKQLQRKAQRLGVKIVLETPQAVGA
jgi:transposase